MNFHRSFNLVFTSSFHPGLKSEIRFYYSVANKIMESFLNTAISKIGNGGNTVENYPG